MTLSTWEAGPFYFLRGKIDPFYEGKRPFPRGKGDPLYEGNVTLYTRGGVAFLLLFFLLRGNGDPLYEGIVALSSRGSWLRERRCPFYVGRWLYLRWERLPFLRWGEGGSTRGR